MKTILAAACLVTTMSVRAETAAERCIAARDTAASVITVDSPTKDQTAKWRAAEKHAFRVCASAEVPVKLRNEAIVRWAGTLNDSAAELTLVKNALRETEAAEGPDSSALLPLIDRLMDLYSNQPASRREGLDLAQRGLRIRRQAFGETSPETVEGLIFLGAFWSIEEMPDRNLPLAERYLREAVVIAEGLPVPKNTCGPACSPLFSALSTLCRVIEGQPGREAEAARIEDRLFEIHAALHSRRKR